MARTYPPPLLKSTAAPLKMLSASSKILLRLIVLGMTDDDIAAVSGRALRSVRRLRNDSLAQAYMLSLQSQLLGEGDPQARQTIAHYAQEAVALLARVARGEEPGTTNERRVQAAEALLDRVGLGAVPQWQEGLTSEEVHAIEARVAKLNERVGERSYDEPVAPLYTRRPPYRNRRFLSPVFGPIKSSTVSTAQELMHAYLSGTG